MPFSQNVSLYRLFALVVAFAIVSTIVPARTWAAADVVAKRDAGSVGYTDAVLTSATAKTAKLNPIISTLALKDNQTIGTKAASRAIVSLPDSSAITIGANTFVQVGAFKVADAATGSGAGATLKVIGGVIRLDIRHPAGGKSNYTFTTNTSQIAVRGTVALIKAADSQDTIACLTCDPGDVDVTDKNGKRYSLITGQVLTVTLAGAVVAAMTAVILGQFAGAGVSTAAGELAEDDGGHRCDDGARQGDG